MGAKMTRGNLAAWANDAGKRSRNGSAPVLSANSSRADLVAWWKWNDGNGDFDSEEDFAAEDAWDAIQQLVDDDAPAPSRAQVALRAFVAAAYELQAAWDNDALAAGYPERLPSFDEFTSELQAWKEVVEGADSLPKAVR